MSLDDIITGNKNYLSTMEEKKPNVAAAAAAAAEEINERKETINAISRHVNVFHVIIN